jgi:single-stranded-DNA-specific exonuclease
VEALRYSSAHLVRFGGHKQAAGLTLKPESFESFYRSVLDYADSHLFDDDLFPFLELDAELEAGQLSTVNCQLLAQLEPFGAGNPRPKFLIKNAQILAQRQVGSAGRHLQLKLGLAEKEVSGIAFNFQPLALGGTYNFACELIEDAWNGRRQVKLRILDLQISKN